MADNKMTRGNTKLDKSILCWSITPIVSCLNCSQCKKDCYAMKPYQRWTNVKNAWDTNFNSAKDGSFFDKIISQLKRSRTCKVVRIHVAGDFFSSDYIQQWDTITDMFPKIKFYAYSKTFKIFPNELEALNKKENCNVINSIAADGGVNFGDEERINTLKGLGYHVCPVSDDNDIICGKECNICVTESLVCFPIH